MVRSLSPNSSRSGEPASLTPRSLSARLGVSIFAVMSIGLLFLSYFGPLIDHHFTERLPQHTHVYLGDTEPEHTHPFEEEHSHGVSIEEAAPHAHEDSPGVTVYLAPDDKSGPTVYDAGFARSTSSIEYPPFDPLKSVYLGSDQGPKTRFVSPPTRPPRI